MTSHIGAEKINEMKLIFGLNLEFNLRDDFAYRCSAEIAARPRCRYEAWGGWGVGGTRADMKIITFEKGRSLIAAN